MKTKRPLKATRRRPGPGRPRSGKTQRTEKVQCSLTPDDAEWLHGFAKDCGFSSRGQFITTILERLRLCGFSPAGGARLCGQIMHRLEQRGKSGATDRRIGFDFESLLRPPPALPEEAPTSDSAEAEALPKLNPQNA